MGGDILDTQAMPVALAETLGGNSRRLGGFTARSISAAKRNVS
jgi:hypothetical protein